MSECIIVGSPRKRKGQNPHLYKGNLVKAGRTKGQSYINHKGQEVAAKKPEFHCRCVKECLAKLGEENCLDVFKEFNNIQSKNEQDLHLQGLIDVVDVQQRRPRPNVENKEQKSASFSYHIIVGTERKQKRVRRIRNLKLLGQTPEDKRGKKRTAEVLCPPSDQAYQDQVPLKSAKVQDIKKLKDYIAEEHIEFFNDIFSWPTFDASADDSSDFEQEEANDDL
ncbi:hypothetical protein J6590_063009 [Homalodisca vitripennis]|nr:hypothetical protein J6590_063009 [Homalodisca vitripennis]